MIPFVGIAHFVGWFIVSLFALWFFDTVIYWFVVIGAFLIMLVYYASFFQKRYFFPAVMGLLLAVFITYTLVI